MSADNKPLFKIVVEAGPNRDCEYAIPAAGARVGRSSQNDIALTDPLLSRHHPPSFLRRHPPPRRP